MPGEIAEMMLNGEMCECCGEWLEGEAQGYPGYCSAECAGARGVELECEAVRGIQRHRAQTVKDRKPYQCAHCARRFSTTEGRQDHFRQVHPEFVAKDPDHG